MIEVRGLTKRYGDFLAVDDLSFVVEPGKVTGFLGPNGAGKSTTMRMIRGLDRPTAGTALVTVRLTSWCCRAYCAMTTPTDRREVAAPDQGQTPPHRGGRVSPTGARRGPRLPSDA